MASIKIPACCRCRTSRHADIPSLRAHDLNDGRLEPIAIDLTRNIHRRYAIELSEDLFGCLILETAWDRVGGVDCSQAGVVSDARRGRPHCSISSAASSDRRTSYWRSLPSVALRVRARWARSGAISAAILVSTPALAWGDYAHRVNADISLRSLTLAASREVDRLLGSEALIATPLCPVSSLGSE